MGTELSRMERPEAAQFVEKRKLYLVPLIFGPPTQSDEFDRLAEQYWSGADAHVRRLENRIGTVAHVYVEGVPVGGNEGLAAMEQQYLAAGPLVRSRVDAGAVFEALEDAETLAEFVDWQRCLMVGLTSQKVRQLAMANYREAENRRGEAMRQKIEETLKPSEAGLLLAPERHGIQFPPDIQVFYVAPPALDDVHNWLRSHDGEG